MKCGEQDEEEREPLLNWLMLYIPKTDFNTFINKPLFENETLGNSEVLNVQLQRKLQLTLIAFHVRAFW